MCGIVAVVQFDPNSRVSEPLLCRMTDALSHRGPDGAGYWIDGPVGLGHRRLAIIDLSTGDQPMSNEDGTVWIVFNGEIYNYPDLRAELEKHGHTFTTRSDTEVIIHAYEEWGPQSCARLRGMFAYALWDGNRRRLVLARDRLGQKPLVYTRTAGAFLFASEIRALLQHPDVSRQVNLEAVYAYLVRLYVPTPQTAFRGIHKLPPAHYMVVEDGRVEIRRYWHVDFGSKWQASEGEYRDRLWELLREATRMRLMSDVPLGAFLSGGVDSSAVVGIMSQLVDEPVKTFSIRYEESGYDETPHARQVARLFETDHHEFTVRPDAMEVLPRLVWHYGEPFADASALPTYYVSQLTRRYVTVALSGDAGDESFAGYERYRTARILDLYRVLPQPVRWNIVPAALGVLGRLPAMKNLFHQLRVVAQRGALPPAEAYLYRYYVFTPELAALFWRQEVLAQLDGTGAADDVAQALRDFRGDDPLDRWLYLDLMCYLPDDILVKVDIASMANSLEVRSPFLDHEVVQFAASLPPEMKRRGLTTKYILKKTLERLLPQEIIHRPKHGFRIPISDWLRGELRGPVREVLLDPAALARGYFRPEQVERLIREHETGQIDHGTRLWELLNLELWHRTFVDELRTAPLVWDARVV
jgi:asparagine synthase (glutamine-hydrolysing)